MYYIYLIQSQSSNLFYVGYSSDPWKRLQEHNTERTDKFTGKYHDWVLKAVFKVSENKGEALQVERFIKRQKSKVLLMKLTDPGFIPNGVLAQLVRVPHLRD
jgi:putative endonuclease